MAYLDALPPDLRPEYALVNEARAIHDTAMLRPADYLPAAGPAWIVAVVNPGSGSGSATVPGAHIEAETGRFLAPSQAEAVVVKTGSWQAVAASNPSEPMGGPYSWTEPLERSVRMPAPEDYYSPFAYGGTIVFRPEPSAGGAEFFGDCGMIFPEWGRSAADALRASPRLTTVFAQAPSDPAALTETARTINGPNGVLAAIAFRMLLDGPVPRVAGRHGDAYRGPPQAVGLRLPDPLRIDRQRLWRMARRDPEAGRRNRRPRAPFGDRACRLRRQPVRDPQSAGSCRSASNARRFAKTGRPAWHAKARGFTTIPDFEKDRAPVVALPNLGDRDADSDGSD